MNKHEFSITINAPREKVWATLWNDATYRQWTAPFMPGSYLKADSLSKGSKVLFLGPDQSGMFSEVAENIPNEYMSFRHLGEVRNGVEDADSAAKQGWQGAMENYTLKIVDGKTELTIDLTGNGLEFLLPIWPKALQILKDLAEKN